LVRKSIVASKIIKKNEKFNVSNITCKRPGFGIPPIFFKKFLGKVSTRDYKKDDLIKLT